jgi:hypothetical protein
LCAAHGLVRGDVPYVDSTLTAANANLDSTGARALVAEVPGLAGVDEHLATVRRDHPGETAEAPPPAGRSTRCASAAFAAGRTRGP